MKWMILWGVKWFPRYLVAMLKAHSKALCPKFVFSPLAMMGTSLWDQWCFCKWVWLSWARWLLSAILHIEDKREEFCFHQV
jgi:hypothetical protein